MLSSQLERHTRHRGSRIAFKQALGEDLGGERPANHCAGDGPDTQVDHAGGNSSLQGGVTESTPGMTPAVRRALANARATCAASRQPNGTEPISTPGPCDV